MMIDLGILFLFSKFWFFWVVRSVKRQKMTRKDKKLCPLCLISQEPYIIWSAFMVHLCKTMTSPDASFGFLKFWFSGKGMGGGEEGWRAKNGPKWQKNSVCLTPYLRNHTSYDRGFWHTCVKWWYLQQLFSFFQICFFFFGGGGGGFGSKRAKNYPNLPNSVCQALYLRNCRSYHQDFWYTGGR